MPPSLTPFHSAWQPLSSADCLPRKDPASLFLGLRCLAHASRWPGLTREHAARKCSGGLPCDAQAAASTMQPPHIWPKQLQTLCSRVPNLLGPSPTSTRTRPAASGHAATPRFTVGHTERLRADQELRSCWTSLVQNQGPIAMTNKWLQRQGCCGDAWMPTPSLMAGHSGGSVRPDSVVSRSKGCRKRGKKLLSTPCATHGVRGNGNSSHQARMPRSSLPTCAGAPLQSCVQTAARQ